MVDSALKIVVLPLSKHRNDPLSQTQGSKAVQHPRASRAFVLQNWKRECDIRHGRLTRPETWEILRL
jgi:hypothetical protein